MMAAKGYEGTRSMVEAANLSLATFLPEVSHRGIVLCSHNTSHAVLNAHAHGML